MVLSPLAIETNAGASSPNPGGWTRTTISSLAGDPEAQPGAIGCWSRTGCIIGGVRGSEAASWTGTTENAGRSWMYTSKFPAPLAGGVQSISCDRRACLMVGENLPENADALGLSFDHGRSWSVVSLPRQWTSASITPDFLGCSSNTCVVYGSNIFAISGANGLSGYRVGLISTTNEGRTWSQGTFPASSSGDLDSITCIGSGRCWALFRPDQPLEGVAVSDNGGRTWATVGGVAEAFDPEHLAGFGCASRADCYLVDDSDELFVTNNGGQTWGPGNPVRDVTGSAELETDALACAPTSGSCYIVGIGPPASLWRSK